MANSSNPNDIIGYNKSRILSTPGDVLRFPKEDIPYKMLLSFSKYSFATSAGLTNSNEQIASAKKNPAGSIVLPLPLQLNDATTVDASVTSAGAATAINNIWENGGNAFDTADEWAGYAKAVSNALLGGGSALLADSKTKWGKRIGAVASTLGVAGQAATGDISQMLGGWAFNPFETMQFKGVRLKQHSFSWRLSPSSAEESVALRDIIKMIKGNILPKYSDPSVDTIHALLQYPAVATISFYGIDQNYYYKLKPSMITSFNVNYNGSDQLNVYRGGKPVVVDIQMQLTEMTIHTAEDYGGSTYAEPPPTVNNPPAVNLASGQQLPVNNPQ